MRFVPILGLAACGAFTAACGGSNFAGSSGHVIGTRSETTGQQPLGTQQGVETADSGVVASTDSASAGAPVAGLVSVSQVLPGLGENAAAVGTCLANLGITQLPPDAAQNFEVLSASGFSPFANENITDPDQNTTPGEVYVRLVQMEGFGPVVNFDMDLLNPAGIYCITTASFSVFTNSKITMCKTGKIASTTASSVDFSQTANLLKVGCD